MSEKHHVYKQIWQGHYTKEKYPNLLQSTFSDGSGCNILQLQPGSDVHFYGARGKQWAIEETKGASSFSFVTVIYPFKTYFDCISVTSQGGRPNINGWHVNQLDFEAEGKDLKSISKNHTSYLLNVQSININKVKIFFNNKTDVFLEKQKGDTVFIRALGFEEAGVKINGAKAVHLNQKPAGRTIKLLPGNSLMIKL